MLGGWWGLCSCTCAENLLLRDGRHLPERHLTNTPLHTVWPRVFCLRHAQEALKMTDRHAG